MGSLISLNAAEFSPDGAHRYWLTREVSANEGTLVWCMLNPSTADATKDDPTIRKVKGFTRRLGYGLALVVNVFSWRATKPRDCLANLADASPDENGKAICNAARGRDVVCAWGAHEWAREEADNTVRSLRHVGARLHCLGLSVGGMPRHPLMLPYSTELVGYDHKEVRRG